ncbi:unnamed protein product [Trichobilharzia szidati]|nr:unnamed protein product [Trichobilharzia szidati]
MCDDFSGFFVILISVFCSLSKDVCPNLTILILDVYNFRRNDSQSTYAVCIFDLLLRVGLIKGLFVEELNFQDGDGLSTSFCIDFTCCDTSSCDSLLDRCDFSGVVDWFVSPLCTLVDDNSSGCRKCCGCSVDALVPNWVTVLCLPHIRPLPLEHVNELLTKAFENLVIALPNMSETNKTG